MFCFIFVFVFVLFFCCFFSGFLFVCCCCCFLFLFFMGGSILSILRATFSFNSYFQFNLPRINRIHFFLLISLSLNSCWYCGSDVCILKNNLLLLYRLVVFYYRYKISRIFSRILPYVTILRKRSTNQSVWRQSSSTSCTWTLTPNLLENNPFPMERHMIRLIHNTILLVE